MKQPTSDRASVIDVFSNFLGEAPSRLPDNTIQSLSVESARDLVALLDQHLEGASNEEFHSDAVLLDSTSDPVIFPSDPLQPMTTRRTKQVALYHHEVVIPMQPLFIDWDLSGSTQLEGLFMWCRAHEPLLANHVLTFAARPNILLDIGEGPTNRLLKKLRKVLNGSEAKEHLNELLGDVNMNDDTIDAFLYGLIDDVYHSTIAEVDLVYIEPRDFQLYELVEAELDAATRRKGAGSKKSLLQKIDLPATDQLSNEDFVAIRLTSAEFAEYRDVLGSTLERTHSALERGVELDEAWNENLDQCRHSIADLEGQIKKSGLSSRLRERLQSMLISLAASGAYPAFQVAKGVPMTVGPLLASSFLGLILNLMATTTNQKAKKRLLRFYKVLTDDLP